MKKSALFYLIFIVLILAELIKGLSANGTPPILQSYEWQLDLAYFMWSNILYIRILLFAILGFLLWKKAPLKRGAIITSLILLMLWGGIYWFFNHKWNGTSKFKPLETPTFVTAAQNEIPLSEEIIGVSQNGVQKAYPMYMMLYHHQFPDKVGNQPILVTYCGLCRSGRVYDAKIDGEALDFTIVGAITYNAVFKDNQTGSWWRQETGEAVKGKYKGKMLADIPMEQMSLENWLDKYPNSEILQYDPKFQERYDFIGDVFSGKASPIKGFKREVVPLIVGIEIGEAAKSYDWEALQKKRVVMDKIGDQHLLLLSSEDGSSPFAYDRTVNGEILDFEIKGNTIMDKKTASTWNLFGTCIAGELEGAQLPIVQAYLQNIRSWNTFHSNSTAYNF